MVDRKNKLSFARQRTITVETKEQRAGFVLGGKNGLELGGLIYVDHVEPESWCDCRGLKQNEFLLSINKESVYKMSSAQMQSAIDVLPVMLTFAEMECYSFS